MSLALGAGEIDLTNRLPKPDYERFNADPDSTVVVALPTLAIWVLGMVIPNENGGHPAFADPKVRQAIYRVIDRQRVAARPLKVWRCPRTSSGHRSRLGTTKRETATTSTPRRQATARVS